MRIATSSTLVAAALAACAAASLPAERRDYILSRPHGWVELTILDRSVPLVPASEDADAELVRPSYCWVAVGLDREPFVSGSVYPTGDAPPFEASSGFRFPAPVGTVHLSLTYSRCDVPTEPPSEPAIGLDVEVTESFVTDLFFDGDRVFAEVPRPDAAVTLERIYEAITGSPRPAP